MTSEDQDLSAEDIATSLMRRRRIRRWSIIFIAALWFSGLTAVPLVSGTRWLAELTLAWPGQWHGWADAVATAIADIDARYPFVFYGTDWLAFAHIIIGMAFIGVLRDPVRNRWVVEWGLWSCALVVVFAFGWAPVRGIPLFWRCVDASFGIVGAVPLGLVLRDIRALEHEPERT